MKRYLTSSAVAGAANKRAKPTSTSSPSSASAATDAEGPCPPKVPVGRDHYIRLVTYNTDGLDGGPQLLARAEAAASILLDPWVPFDGLGNRSSARSSSRQPEQTPIRVPADAILLQEVTVVTAPVFISALAGAGYSCHPAELPPRDVGGYFTLVFLRDDRFTVVSAERRPFRNTKMGRDLVKVTAKLKPRKGHEEEEDPLPFLFMTSHFESLADPVHAKERCAQLSEALDELLAFLGPAVLGADTNLREKEVSAEPKYRRVIDGWVAAGSPADAKATWDMSKNDNKKIGFQTTGGGRASLPRCRFDRILLNPQWLAAAGAPPGQGHGGDDETEAAEASSPAPKEGVDGLVERWELLGTERLTCGCFPSDHFGISCLLRLPPRARPGPNPRAHSSSAGGGGEGGGGKGSGGEEPEVIAVN